MTDWGQAGVVLHYSLTAYTAYEFSTLSFILQLEPPPFDWRSHEYRAFWRLLPGPRGWVLPSGVRGLPLLGLTTSTIRDP